MAPLMNRARAVIAASSVAVLAYACAADSPDITGAPELSLGQQQGLEQAMRAQERHTATLMARGDVVGTAVGLDAAGGPALYVYLLRGEGRGLPAELEGFRVIPQVTGPIVALNRVPQGAQARGRSPSVDRTARFPRPVPIGVSTGHPNITAGTIGARVKAGSGVFALSNNHVYADENRAALGDGVLQPGAYDGGRAPEDVIGTLAAYEPIVFSTSASNVIDAAIAATTTDMLGKATPADGYGVPGTLVLNAYPGLRVMKYGRTTGLTKARVQAINGIVNVQYDRGVARFVNQVIIQGGGFSAGGDSGSLIVGQSGAEARRPVALLFAGGNGITVGNPISAVLSAFGVSIDGN